MEWILITVAIITFYLVSNYIRKQLSPKTNLIISLIGFMGLVIMFISAKDRFTTLPLIVFIVIAIIYLVTLYFRFKKLKNE